MLPRPVLLLVLANALLLIGAQSAIACTCGPQPGLLESIEDADEVVILRAISVDKVENTPERNYRDGVRSTTMVVEKVFKGNLKVGQQIAFAQGGGGNCVNTFGEQAIGEQFLFYLTRPEKLSQDFFAWKDPSLWIDSVCDRSTHIDGAGSDLLYLENMSKVKGKTRISGSLDARQDTGIDFSGKTVKFVGPKKTYKTLTNKNGIFEIYDLPPGKYSVEPEKPFGWKIDPVYVRYSLGVGNDEYQKSGSEWEKRVEVTLEPKKHIALQFVLIPDNFVRGRVLGPKGLAMPDVCVSLLRLGQDNAGPTACTDEQGRFELSSIAKGDHVLVANQAGKLSNRQPFPKIFYPNVTQRERAALINVAPGQILEDVDIVIPKLEETITIEGVLRYSDGKPAAGRYVNFNVAQTDTKVDGNVTERTESDGRFTLTVLKGLKGELVSESYLIRNYYKNCPKVDELIAKSGADHVEVYSNKIELTTEQNLYHVELTLPYPRCERK